MSNVKPQSQSTRPPKPVRRKKPPGVKPIQRVRHPQSSNHGTVLFLGDAQSGKSTTLNFLFGGENKVISPVGQNSETTSILEFRSVHPVDNLRVIDTPGLGAPNCLEWDAQIMATLKKFLDTDVELSRCIPHVVVIVTRFDASEAEFGHPKSNFVKTLKALSLLRARLFDEHHSNVIVVLTHFMKGKQRYRLVPQPVLEKVKYIIRINLDISYDPHLVLAENQPRQMNVSQTGNNFRLTNGDVYPENLKEAFLTAASTSKSTISYEYFHQILKQTHEIVFQPVHVVIMVDPERTRYRKFLEALIMTSSSSSV